MALCECSDDGVSAIDALIRMPPIEPEHVGELAKRLEPIRSILDMKLPEEIAGPIADDTASPAVLLCSRSDGKLNLGLRVRTSQGVLRTPGAPPLMSASKRDEKIM